MADQVSSQQAPTPTVDGSQGPSRWIGRAVGTVFLVLAIITVFVMFTNNDQETASPPAPTQAVQPTPPAATPQPAPPANPNGKSFSF